MADHVLLYRSETSQKHITGKSYSQSLGELDKVTNEIMGNKPNVFSMNGQMKRINKKCHKIIPSYRGKKT